MNNVVLIGRLTKDPELRYIPNSGTPVSTFILAVDKNLSKEKKMEMETKNQPTADFIKIIVWGKQAENCVNHLAKGRLVGIQGRIQTGSYQKDDKRVYTTDVVANQVKFLEWGKDRNGHAAGTEEDYPDMDGFHPIDDMDIPF